MKKLCSVILILLMIIYLCSVNVYAADLNLALYTSETLEEAFLDENIQGYDLTNYNQNDTNRVPVYVFRKKGCGNCKNFLNYVAQNLLPTHGDKFRIVSYEVGNTPANFGLINKIQSYLLGNTTNTVATPYIIIGDKIFSGFIDISKQQQIENTILDLYNSNKYDVLADMQINERNFYNNITNISMRSSKGINKNYLLKTVEVDKSTENYVDTYEYIKAFDIYITDNTGTEVTVNDGEYKISIPISTTYDMYKVAHVKNGKIVGTLDTIYNNGYIQFTTPNFSDFVIYGKNNVETPPVITPSTVPDANPSAEPTSNQSTVIQNKGEKNPKTADKINLYIAMMLIGIFTLLASSKYITKKVK